MLLFSVGNLMLILFQGILSALKKFNLQNVILGVCNYIFLLYLFFCWRTGLSLSLYHVAVAYALLLFIQGILMLVFCTREPSPEKPDQSFDKLLFLRSGWFIMISSLVYFAFLRVDNFFVERYCDPVTLGNYVQCGKIGQYFLYFSSIISSTLLPFIATETVGASYNEWKDMMKPYITLICLAAFLLALSGSYLFPMFFGEEFNRIHIYMLILLPGFVCLGILTLLNSVYIGKGNVKMIFIGDVLGLISVLLFDWLFVGRYGAVAAAVISLFLIAWFFYFYGVVLKSNSTFLPGLVLPNLPDAKNISIPFIQAFKSRVSFCCRLYHFLFHCLYKEDGHDVLSIQQHVCDRFLPFIRSSYLWHENKRTTGCIYQKPLLEKRSFRNFPECFLPLPET